MLAFRFGERTPPSDTMPFLQAASAAGRRGVLGDKHRVAPVRSLLSIASREGGCEPVCNEAIGVLQYCLESPLSQVVSFPVGQMEALPER
jgi:hypothetical protein